MNSSAFFPMRLLALWICIVIGVVEPGRTTEPGSSPEPSGSAQDDALIQSLDSAVAQWLHDLEFVCTYRYTQHRAATVEDGLMGKFGHEFKDERISGVFNKAFGKMRVSRIYEREPLVTSESERGSTVAFLDVEEVANATMSLRYNPVVNPARPRGSAFFTREGIVASDAPHFEGPKYGPGPMSLRSVSPLSLTGDEPGSVLHGPAGARLVSRSVVSSTPETVVVEVISDFPDSRFRSRVGFSLQWSTPIVTTLSLTVVQAAATTEYQSQAFDFVELPTGPVARRIAYAWHRPDAKYPKLPWFVMQWVSKDLGSREPSQEDFLVPIVANTSIGGLEHPETALRDGKLDIDLASGARPLKPFDRPSSRGSLPAEDSPPPGVGRWLSGTGLVACIALVFTMWLRRRARSSRS